MAVPSVVLQAEGRGLQRYLFVSLMGPLSRSISAAASTAFFESWKTRVVEAYMVENMEKKRAHLLGGAAWLQVLASYLTRVDGGGVVGRSISSFEASK